MKKGQELSLAFNRSFFGQFVPAFAVTHVSMWWEAYTDEKVSMQFA